MKLLSRIPSWLKNKFFISIVAFIAWMLFFDKNDYITQYYRTKELEKLQKSRQYYTNQISSEKQQLEHLKSNPATLEKYAREKYFMKRDNEELFLIPENQQDQKN